MNAKKPVTVKLVGGIGNQLFGYFAGLSLSLKLGVNLRLDISDIRSGRVSHKSSIESLDLPGEFFSKSKDYHLLNSTWTRVQSKIKGKFPTVNHYSQFYVSPVVGYDDRLLAFDFNKRHISGYFQSYRYFEYCSNVFIKPTLKSPSSWYARMQQEISNSRVAVIHIRRGDYKELSSSFGLLSHEYYKSALDLILKENCFDDFWVFSDDISEAKLVLGSLSKKVTLIEPPLESDPVESLLLMSFASANIIANSTYSWWSAMLNNSANLVVAPKKWFRRMDDPIDIYPPYWKLEESYWTS